MVTVIGGIFSKKKLPPPSTDESMQHQQNSEAESFDIPILANDPNIPQLPNQEIVIDTQPSNIESIYRQRQQFKQVNQKLPKVNKNESTEMPAFNQMNALDAMIYSEIFGKPKSLRRKL